MEFQKINVRHYVSTNNKRMLASYIRWISHNFRNISITFCY